jgi:hypothetical protein
MGHDPEIVAMNKVFNVFRNLDNGKRERIIHWLTDRFGLTGDKPPPELTQPANVNIKKQTETKPIVEEKPAEAVKTLKKRGIEQYDTVLDLFSEARVKKSTGKVLLMAAYLQERHHFKEITTYDINFRLKRIKHGVTNISSLINGILKGKPQLLDEIKDEGQTKHSRRKFRVTEEGLKVAKSYL